MSNKTPRLWAGIALIAVLLIWGISAACNAFAGWTLAGDVGSVGVAIPGWTYLNVEPLKVIFAGASISLDVIKAVALFACVAAFASGRKFIAIGACMFFALASLWSLRSATYTSTYALLTNKEQREVTEQLQKSRKDLLDVQTARAGFLAQQSVNATKVTSLSAKYRSGRTAIANLKVANAEARKANEDTAANYDKAISGIKDAQYHLSTNPVISTADPLAALAKDLFEVDEKVTILGTSIFFAFILEVISGLGFLVFARAAERRPTLRTLEAANQDTKQDEVLPEQDSEQDAQEDKIAVGETLSRRALGIARWIDMTTKVPPTAEPPVLPQPPKPRLSNKRNRQPASEDNVVELRPVSNEALEVLKASFEQGSPEDRVRLSTVTHVVNRSLSRAKKLKTSIQTSALLDHMGFGPEYRQISGGQVWVYGIRLIPEQPGEKVGTESTKAVA